MSFEFLRRDIINVFNYFRKKGVDVEDLEGKFCEFVEG